MQPLKLLCVKEREKHEIEIPERNWKTRKIAKYVQSLDQVNNDHK